jgi:hypothetical protein
MEVVEATYEFCRLCMNDLSELPEYYAIDESLRDLTASLTGIMVCFVIVNFISKF